MIEEIIQKPNSPVVAFSSKWDVKYPQVIDKVVSDLKFYYSKAKNLSGGFRDYLAQNRLYASGIRLHRVSNRIGLTVFRIIGRPKDMRKGNYKASNKPKVVGKLTFKRIIKHSDAIVTIYHLTFKVNNLSVSNGFLYDRQLSIKEAESFSGYAKSELGMNVRHTTKAFY